MCIRDSPGSAEALVRCGGKIKYILIAYFLGNICAKNCRNWTVHVKIITSCKGGTFFWDTVYIFGGSCPLTEFSQMQNSPCFQVLRSPILAALLHGTRAVGVSQTLRHSTRKAADNGVPFFPHLYLVGRPSRGTSGFPQCHRNEDWLWNYIKYLHIGLNSLHSPHLYQG